MTDPIPPRRAAVPWWHDAQELLSSMRFAISLLAVICIASVVGTVVKQGEPFNNYVDEFGPFWADVFRAAGLFTVYSASWFLLILAFLVLSTSLCIARNAPKFIADFRTMKQHVREGALPAFHHHGEGRVARDLAGTQAAVTTLLADAGWKVVVDTRPNGTMVAARKGRINRIGYIFAHGAVVLVCIGALLDGDFVVRAQMWLTGKTPYAGVGAVREVAPEHRLGAGNPTFRGNLFVPEGRRNDTAVLQLPDGVVLQPLSFDVELKRFKVEYYETGMPKLFASDILIHDHANGATTAATVKVNQPVFHDGVAIYQSSFEDGGSAVRLKAVPMRAGVAPFDVATRVGENTPLVKDGGGEKLTLEMAELKVINVENLDTAATAAATASGAAAAGWQGALVDHLGSGAKGSGTRHLHNVGPAIVYRLRDASGQAREYHDYMVPVELDGQRVFLAGMRETQAEGFRYLRLPADENDKLDGWLRLRDALADPALRDAAAQAYAQRNTPADRPEMAEQLRVTSQRILSLFAGAAPKGAFGAAEPGAPTPGGLEAVSRFIEQTVPQAERPKIATVLVRILDGSVFELNNLARAKAGLGPMAPGLETEAFMTQAVRSLSDAFFYPAPFMLQLDSFDQVQASVFQVARAPGKKLVYLGAILLILGVFTMLHVRERRVWCWLAAPQGGAGAEPGAAPGTDVTVAMSTARRTLDTDAEFDHLKHQLLTLAPPYTP